MAITHKVQVTERVHRFDTTGLRKAERTPQGGLRVPAAVTRVGVLTYRGRDASGAPFERREYRPPEEVFHADSLRTLEDAPVTILHPTEMVSPESYSKLAVGHARNARRDGEFVAADVVVQDVQAVRRVDSRELCEVSMGYVCEVDETPGVTPSGDRYDAVQRTIRYNHVGLGPRGWGRAAARSRSAWTAGQQ